MKKQTKQDEASRKAGPKFARSVIPENFQIRRSPSPMAAILNEADLPVLPEKAEQQGNAVPRKEMAREGYTPVKNTVVEMTPVKSAPVNLTPVKMPTAKAKTVAPTLPELMVFIDDVLPLFPPAQQAILLRLYRWSEGTEQDITVSTPRLAAKINLDEKSVRAHLQKLTAQGFLVRQNDGQHIAKFGGADRSARGLILRLSAAALMDLIA